MLISLYCVKRSLYLTLGNNNWYVILIFFLFSVDHWKDIRSILVTSVTMPNQRTDAVFPVKDVPTLGTGWPHQKDELCINKTPDFQESNGKRNHFCSYLTFNFFLNLFSLLLGIQHHLKFAATINTAHLKCGILL